MNKLIGVIGAGNMGRVICAAICSVLGKESLIVADRNTEKRNAVEARSSFESAGQVVEESNVVVIAVKPQGLDDLLKETEGKSWTDKLVISVMAGVTMETIAKKTEAQKIIRVMPNVAMSVGKGTVGWVASGAVTDGEKMLVQRIFGESGIAIELQDEAHMDAFTALAGSGPAYFLHLTELLSKKAEAYGFSPAEAERIARQVCIGTGELLSDGGLTVAEWKQAISSRGGTTEAALASLTASAFEQDFHAALDAATNKSKDLSS